MRSPAMRLTRPERPGKVVVFVAASLTVILGFVARAVASARWAAPKVGILVLDPTGSGSLFDNGGGAISVTGASTIVDSNAADAATTTGSGSILSQELDITGVPGTQGSGFLGPLY